MASTFDPTFASRSFAPHTASSPCPVCHGYDDLTRHRGIRCWGGILDGRTICCTREDMAGDAPWVEKTNSYQHRFGPICPCGTSHGGESEAGAPVVRRGRQPKRLLPAWDSDYLYRLYLRICRLRPEHAAYLRSRGPENIRVAQQYEYGSLPYTEAEVAHVLKAMQTVADDRTLLRLPGFYRDQDQLRTHAAYDALGEIAIPVCDQDGRIVSIQRRSINPDRPKYRMFAGTPGDLCAVAGRPNSERVLYLTEGVHKAYVAAAVGDIWVMGLPGVYLQDRHIQVVRDLQPRLVVEALDADKLTNPDVMSARTSLLAKLYVMSDVRVISAEWNLHAGKGLDDILIAGAPLSYETKTADVIWHFPDFRTPVRIYSIESILRGEDDEHPTSSQ